MITVSEFISECSRFRVALSTTRAVLDTTDTVTRRSVYYAFAGWHDKLTAQLAPHARAAYASEARAALDRVYNELNEYHKHLRESEAAHEQRLLNANPEYGA